MVTNCVVPPIRTGGAVPIAFRRFARHVFVASTSCIYAGKVKNSRLISPALSVKIENLTKSRHPLTTRRQVLGLIVDLRWNPEIMVLCTLPHTFCLPLRGRVLKRGSQA
jgi:hypothetical protein